MRKLRSFAIAIVLLGGLAALLVFLFMPQPIPADFASAMNKHRALLSSSPKSSPENSKEPKNPE